jgi:hypothetical protein
MFLKFDAPKESLLNKKPLGTKPLSGWREGFE